MKKILEVNIDDNGYGGVYAFLLNLLENINHEFKIDICSFEKFEKQANINYVESFGGKVYYCGHLGNVWLKQWNCLKNLYYLISTKKYDVIHVHSDVSYKLFLYALASKFAGAKCILIHSHSTGVEGRYRKIKLLLQCIARIGVPFIADYFLACSQKAAEWMFPKNVLKRKNFTLINNGINTKKFKFDWQMRNIVRKKFNLEKNFVIGHVGRFSYPKNHLFLIDIFKEIIKNKPEAKLILIGSYVGNPTYLSKTKNRVKQLGIEKSVLFMGLRNDVPQLMQAMDCFVLPSRFEGLPIVGIEAQAAGLPCFFSDTITQELGITKLAHFISLNESPAKWAEIILNNRKTERKDMQPEIAAEGYDVKYEIHKLEKIYQGDK